MFCLGFAPTIIIQLYQGLYVRIKYFLHWFHFLFQQRYASLQNTFFVILIKFINRLCNMQFDRVLVPLLSISRLEKELIKWGMHILPTATPPNNQFLLFIGMIILMIIVTMKRRRGWLKIHFVILHLNLPCFHFNCINHVLL